MAPSSYTFTYFNLKARGEPIRFLLAYGGVDWKDVRVEFPQWPAVKKTTPLGKLPLLEVDGKVLYQSMSITRYLAKQFNLLGDSDMDAVDVDIAIETINDFKALTVDYLKSFLFGGDKDVLAKLKEPLMKEHIPFYFARFEEQVKANRGFFVNGKVSYADVTWAALVDSWSGALNEDLLKDYPNLKKNQDTVLALPGIKEWVAKRPKNDY